MAGDRWQAGKPANEVAELNRGAAAAFGLRENEYQQMAAVTTATARELRDIVRHYGQLSERRSAMWRSDKS